MKLTVKLVLAFMAVVCLIAAIRGFLIVETEIREFEHEFVEDVISLAHLSQSQLAEAYQQRQQAGLTTWQTEMNLERDHHEMRFDHIEILSRGPDSQDAIVLSSEPNVAPPDAMTMLWRNLLVVHAPDESVFARYAVIPLNEQQLIHLHISRSYEELDQKSRDVILATLGLMATILLVTGSLSTLVGIKIVGQPLKQLTEKTRRIAAGDLSGPVHLRTHDELEELADCVNDMCEKVAESQDKLRTEAAARVAAVERLRHADRLHTVGQLAAGVAHELGTPLNVISGRAGLIASGKLAEVEVADSAKTIKQQAEHMTTIIRQLMEFARRNRPQQSETDLRKVVEQAGGLLSTLAQKRNVSLSLDLPTETCIANVDVGQIHQVLTNLIVNAVHAMPDGGRLDVGVRLGQARPPEDHGGAAGPFYSIFVRDEGVGMTEENMQHMFEPFFTTKDVGEGTGLGLSIAYGIVQEHGGWIDVTSEPEKGSCFTVNLPKEVAPPQE